MSTSKQGELAERAEKEERTHTQTHVARSSPIENKRPPRPDRKCVNNKLGRERERVREGYFLRGGRGSITDTAAKSFMGSVCALALALAPPTT